MKKKILNGLAGIVSASILTITSCVDPYARQGSYNRYNNNDSTTPAGEGIHTLGWALSVTPGHTPRDNQINKNLANYYNYVGNNANQAQTLRGQNEIKEQQRQILENQRRLEEREYSREQNRAKKSEYTWEGELDPKKVYVVKGYDSQGRKVLETLEEHKARLTPEQRNREKIINRMREYKREYEERGGRYDIIEIRKGAFGLRNPKGNYDIILFQKGYEPSN
jgi:hypothetical protein